MLKRIAVALGVLCLAALLLSFLTDGVTEPCCAAATIPCVRLAKQEIATGKEPRAEEAKELACLSAKLALKEAEWRVLIAKPDLHTWRLRMTRAEIVFLRGTIGIRHVRTQDAN